MNYVSVAGSVEIERSITQPTEPDVRKLIDDYGRSYREKILLNPEIGAMDYFIFGKVDALEYLLKRLGQEVIIKKIRMGIPLQDISNIKLSTYPTIKEPLVREVLLYYEVAQGEIYLSTLPAVFSGITSTEFERYQGMSSVFEEFLSAIGQSSAASKIANFAQARLNARLIQQKKTTYLL